MTTSTIRLATEKDAESVGRIYAPIVVSTATSFEQNPPSTEEIANRIRKTLPETPWLICAMGDEVQGYAYASRFRERAAYQWTVEVTVYVSPDHYRQGIGSRLYASLLACLRVQGFHTALAVIALPNDASVRLHERLGFEPVGVFRDIGFKLDRWHDVGWWRLSLEGERHRISEQASASATSTRRAGWKHRVEGRALRRRSVSISRGSDTAIPVAWLGGMSTMLFFALLPMSSYVVTLPLIQHEWASDNTETAVVFSAYLVGLALASVLILPLSDRHPPERFVIGGVVLLTLSHVVFPLLARGPLSGSLFRALAGAGHLAVYYPGIRMISQRIGAAKRGGAIATFVAAGYLGTSLSYSVTGWFLRVVDSWQAAYLWTSVVGAVAFPLAWFACQGDRLADPAVRGVLSLRPLRDRSVSWVIVAYALHSAELYLTRLWLPLLLGAWFSRQGMGSTEATAMAATRAGWMFTAGVAGVFLGGLYSDRVGRTRAAMVIFGISTVCSFSVGWTLDGPAAIIMACGGLYGFATAADSSIYSTAVIELTGSNGTGSALALLSFSGFLAGAVVPVLAGVILDRLTGDLAWVTAFSFNGLIGLAGIVALRRVDVGRFRAARD